MNFNKAIILGNVTRDPEIRALPSGQNVASFGVATNRFYNDQSGNRQQLTEFHNVVAFGKIAETCRQYLKKGSLVMIEGRIQTRSWKAQDGSPRQRTEIVTEGIQLGPRREKTGDFEPAANTPAKKPATQKDDDIPVIDADEEESDKGINPDDIPF